MKYLAFAIATTLSLAASNAVAQTSSMIPQPAFDGVAETDSALEEINGGTIGPIAHYRESATADSIGFLQRIGRDSALALDNWWAQTGAALVNNNLLSAR